MKDRHRIFAGTYRVVWAILLAAFVILGGREVWIGPSEANFIQPGPFASTDAMFKAFFQAPDGSRRCLEIMRQLYGKGTIVFFSPPNDDYGTFAFFLISYLSWPQSLRRVEVERMELEQRLRSLDRISTPAVIFCNLQPSAEFTRGWRLGPRIFIAPLGQAK